jgi:hypothetical protein
MMLGRPWFKDLPAINSGSRAIPVAIRCASSHVNAFACGVTSGSRPYNERLTVRVGRRGEGSTKPEHLATILLSNSVARLRTRQALTDGPAKIAK